MFSIVIPLYNKEQYILKAIDCVLNQTFTDFELIIVNDGSTDGSLEVLSQVSDIRIKVFSKPNGGVSSARNKGIELSSGKYIAFLDADDLWDVNYLLEMSKLINKYPQAVMYASAYEVIEKSNKFVNTQGLGEGIIPSYFNIAINYPIVWTSAVIIRRNILNDVGGFPYGMVSGEDLLTFAKVANLGKVAFTPKVLAYYNYVSSGANGRMYKKDTSIESWIDLYKEGNDDLNEYIAFKGIENGIRHTLGFHKDIGKLREKEFLFTKKSQKRLRFLKIINRTPNFILKFYNLVRYLKSKSKLN